MQSTLTANTPVKHREPKSQRRRPTPMPRTRTAGSSERQAQAAGATEHQVRLLAGAAAHRTWMPQSADDQAPRTRASLQPARKRGAGDLVACSPQGDEYRYLLNQDGTARIVRCTPAAKSVVVPSKLDGRTVTELGDSSFSDLPRIESVVCPSGIRGIGIEAFSGCLNLARVELPEGLESIGEEAFARCWALTAIDVPSTVKTLGAHIVGTMCSRWHNRFTEVRIPASNPHLLANEDGVIYKRSELGLILLDGTHFTDSVLSTLPDTMAIAPRAFSSNTSIEQAILNEGLRIVGEAAFRGCGKLQQVAFPETLEEIGEGAFSRAKLREAYLPASCTRLAPHALETGPVIAVRRGGAVDSTLESIRVHPENPVYCTISSVLCKRLAPVQSSEDADPAFEAVLCPRSVDTVHLPKAVRRIQAATFSGTARIGTLRLHESTLIECIEDATESAGRGTGALLPHLSCERVIIEFEGAERAKGPAEGARQEPRIVEVEIPFGDAGKKALGALRARLTLEPANSAPEQQDATEDANVAGKAVNHEARTPNASPTPGASAARLDIPFFLQTYDQALENVPDKLERAHAMASRLASPALLSEHSKALFEQTLQQNLETICIHFGARAWWKNIDKLLDARIVNAGNISRIIDALSAAGDALSVSHLLAAQRERFGKARWDFAI